MNFSVTSVVQTLDMRAGEVNQKVYQKGKNAALPADLQQALATAFECGSFKDLVHAHLAFLSQELRLPGLPPDFLALAKGVHTLGEASEAAASRLASQDQQALASGQAASVAQAGPGLDRATLLEAAKISALWIHNHIYRGGQNPELPGELREALDLAFSGAVRVGSIPIPAFDKLSDAQLQLVVAHLERDMAHPPHVPPQPPPVAAEVVGPSRKADRLTFDSYQEGVSPGEIRREVVSRASRALVISAWGALNHGRATAGMTLQDTKAYTEAHWKELSPYMQEKALQEVLEDAMGARPTNRLTQALGRTVTRMRAAHQAVAGAAMAGQISREPRALQAARYGAAMAVACLEAYQYATSAANSRKTPQELASWPFRLLDQAGEAIQQSTALPDRSKATSMDDINSFRNALRAAVEAGDRRAIAAIAQLVTTLRMARGIYDPDSKAQSFGGALRFVAAESPAQFARDLGRLFESSLAQIDQRPPIHLAPLFTKARDESRDVGAFAYNTQNSEAARSSKLDAEGLAQLKASLDRVKEPIIFARKIQDVLATPTEGQGFSLPREGQQRAFLGYVLAAKRYASLEDPDLAPGLRARVQRGLDYLSFQDQAGMLQRLLADRLL